MNKYQIILKLSFTIICTTLLFYQTSEIIIKYLSGKTVVNLEVKRIEHDHLPGITICLPEAISMERVQKYFPKYADSYQEYLKAYNQYVMDVGNYNKINITNPLHD